VLFGVVVPGLGGFCDGGIVPGVGLPGVVVEGELPGSDPFGLAWGVGVVVESGLVPGVVFGFDGEELGAAVPGAGVAVPGVGAAVPGCDAPGCDVPG
jgi:hypothetical protein